MGLKIVHLSDTHNKHKDILNIDDGDIIIHSGDATGMGYLSEVTSFLTWFGSLPHKHKIFVAGNHDWLFDEDPVLANQLSIDNGIIWLQNEAITIDGIKFYGTADQPVFFDWAFNKNSHELLHSYVNIPDDTDVLITHCPPKGMLDYTINRYNPQGVHVGSEELNIHLLRLKNLKAHLFGHIHYSSGQKLHDGIIYSNGAICDESYRVTYNGNIIEID